MPEPIELKSQRAFVRRVLDIEAEYRAQGTDIGSLGDSELTLQYRNHLNADGSPSETVAAGYVWAPGTELLPELTREQGNGRREPPPASRPEVRP